MGIVRKPAYISMDDKNRESFLSQIGSFLSSERVIFHTLCQMWQPQIPYTDVTAAVSKISMSGLSDFKQLMDKLRAKGVGLIRTTVENRAQIPHYVVLCDEWSTSFFYEVIGEWMVETRIFSKHPLPTATAMKKQNLVIPQQLVTKVTLAQALQLYEATKEENTVPKILQIPLYANEIILIGTDQIGLLLNIIVLKLRNEFRKTDTLGKLARQTGKSIIDIKQQVNSNETSVWNWVITAVLGHINEWEEHDPEIVHCSYFLKQYLADRTQNQQEKEQQNKEKEEHYREIIELILTAPDLIVPMVELEANLKAYKEIYDTKFVQFREDFLTRFLKPITNNRLPLLLGFGDKILHKDNVCKYFLAKFYELSGNLTRACTKSMILKLKGDATQNSKFKSPHHFEMFVRELVHTSELFVYALLERPILLGEIIAHHFKNMRKTNPKKFEQLLKRFFNIDEMKIRPYVKIFELNIEGIFESGFSKLPFIKKIWLRINGQYTAVRSEFQWNNVNEEMFEIPPKETDEDPISSKQLQKLRLSKIIAGETDDSDASQINLARTRQQKEKIDSSSEIAPKNKENHSDKQLEELWSDFKQAISGPKKD